ncbi:hypothetical protein Rahaq2_2210 [Rahnella aquatilis CIP 78.65 = ATCC 33071]|uniref:Uncharacterized protein n=1 Tax=Rahnella aquatilis (strain ATCC 33071 / DSM 4594 / JCM 1683 / NBRC 105701 / NCIMB 13365 / CIP 78.65) TaxID=745277 RepID=H2IYQ5_RAHAC|nr:hypothetical protein Rahaq2_2210 [Rahnella aquatilis CIP 78.65 = ATCC 33071]
MLSLLSNCDFGRYLGVQAAFKSILTGETEGSLLY